MQDQQLQLWSLYRQRPLANLWSLNTAANLYEWRKIEPEGGGSPPFTYSTASAIACFFFAEAATPTVRYACLLTPQGLTELRSQKCACSGRSTKLGLWRARSAISACTTTTRSSLCLPPAAPLVAWTCSVLTAPPSGFAPVLQPASNEGEVAPLQVVLRLLPNSLMTLPLTPAQQMSCSVLASLPIQDGEERWGGMGRAVQILLDLVVSKRSSRTVATSTAPAHSRFHDCPCLGQAAMLVLYFSSELTSITLLLREGLSLRLMFASHVLHSNAVCGSVPWSSPVRVRGDHWCLVKFLSMRAFHVHEHFIYLLSECNQY